MKKTTQLKSITKRSSLRDRIIAWSKDMNVLDFTLPTENPHASPNALYNVFYKGRLRGEENVLIRLQSACTLGRIWGFDDCYCQNQLLESYRLLRKEQKGLLIYCHDDHGKGVGINNHLRTLFVEKFKGVNEDEARSYLGLKDSRDYKPIITILDYFGIKSIRLLTNNPSKLNIFEQNLIPVQMTPLTL